MSIISLTYPESGLTVNVSVYVKGSATLDNSGVATETGTTKTYIYEFTGAENTDYVYVASSAGYQDMGGVLIYESTGGGGATIADIWGAQISDYSGTAGTFATKFEQYGGVSHVIHDSKGAELSVEEKELIRKNKELMERIEKKLLNNKQLTEKEVLSIIQSNTPSVIPQNIDLSPFTESIKSMRTTISDLIKKISDLENKEIPDSGEAEVITGVIEDYNTDVMKKFDKILDMFKGYEEIIELLQSDNEKYKKIVGQLTN